METIYFYQYFYMFYDLRQMYVKIKRHLFKIKILITYKISTQVCLNIKKKLANITLIEVKFRLSQISNTMTYIFIFGRTKI